MVDIREESPSFGKWFCAWLSNVTPTLLWVPPGFAHGFLALTLEAEVLYKVTEPRVKDDERVLAWNDPFLNIRWPLKRGEPFLSERDQKGMSWSEFLERSKNTQT
jgi:dTDP-4-dehydrorhamnose 3,5-epimerase